MADVNVTDLTQETYSTMDGTEQFVMFDSAEGKRATVAAVGEYVLKKLTTSLNGSTQTVANALASLNSDQSYKAGDSITGQVIALGRALTAGNGVYIQVPLPKPVTASSISVSVTGGNIFTSNGQKAIDTSTAISQISKCANGIRFALPITGSITAGSIAICELNGVTITFS